MTWLSPSTRWPARSPTGKPYRFDYRYSYSFVFRVLTLLIEKTKVGVSALEICKYGDDLIVQETDKIYKKEKDMTKGVAFPTQANVNHCICHYAPLSSVQKDVIMKDGDVVKLDLGVHVDGYIAVVAHTVILGDAKKGRAVDALLAAHYCAEAALRLVRPGKEVSIQILKGRLLTFFQEQRSYRCCLQNLRIIQLPRRRRYALVPDGKGHHRWKEDNHPEPN